MSRTGLVSDTSTTGGPVRDRVSRLGVARSRVRANVARAYGVAEVEEGFMNNPNTRTAILSRRATHMGLGVALGNQAGDRRELFVTQIFVEWPEKLAAADR
jgi:uncharacterized protein YkwD